MFPFGSRRGEEPGAGRKGRGRARGPGSYSPPSGSSASAPDFISSPSTTVA